MSVMKFRESNEVLWRGFRPGHNGVQVHGYQHTVDTEEDVLLVSTGKTLHISYIFFSTDSTAVGVNGTLIWTTSANALVETLMRHRYAVAGQQSSVVAPVYPIEIPAGNKLRAFSSAATIATMVSVFGWEE